MLRELRTALGACRRRSEAKLNAVRRYKTEEFIRIGLHDLGGSIELVPVLQQLSDLAEACLQAALDLTLAELSEKYRRRAQRQIRRHRRRQIGRKRNRLQLRPRFGFYLRSGGRRPKRAAAPKASCRPTNFIVRVGQKLPTYLSAPTEEGIAYKIDMQLRPSGKSGPVVCSLGRLSRLSPERRAAVGTSGADQDPLHRRRSSRWAKRLRKSSNGSPTAPGSPPDGVGEIHHLRMRMERELAGEDDSRFNLKKGRGGLVDIEFLTQMLQLAHGHRIAQAAPARNSRRAQGARSREDSSSRASTSCSPTAIYSCAGSIIACAWSATNRIDAFDAEPGRLDGIAKALGYSEPEESKFEACRTSPGKSSCATTSPPRKNPRLL